MRRTMLWYDASFVSLIGSVRTIPYGVLFWIVPIMLWIDALILSPLPTGVAASS